MKWRASNRTSIEAACLAIAALGGAFLPIPNIKTSSPKGAIVSSAGQVCAGGTKAPIDISFAPSVIVKTSRGEALTLHLRAKHDFQSAADAKVAYAIEVGSDDGKAIGSVIQSGTKTLTTASPIDSDVNIGELPDGYYRATVTAVGTANGESGDVQSNVYWRVLKGRVEPMEFNDWFNESPSAGKAVTL